METTTINIYFFNDFYKKNRRSVHYYIYKMTHDPLATEELVNDVFMKVYKNMHTFKEEKSQFKTWVYNIAMNATIDYLRKKKLETHSMYDVIITDHDGEKKDEMDFTSSENDPLAALITNESREKITKAMKKLKPIQAEILSQYAYGYSYDEIAEELNMPLGTVKATLHIARTKMKEMFAIA